MEPPSATQDRVSSALIRDIARGDIHALGKIYAQYAPAVHRLAVALTLSADDADDVVQDVFIGLPEALSVYGERGAFEGWLLRITARVALRKVRAHSQDVGDEYLALVVATPDPILDRITLEAALGTLPRQARLIVVLKVLAGYSHEEIAAHFGLRRNAVEVRLFRALAKLRTLLSTTERHAP